MHPSNTHIILKEGWTPSLVMAMLFLCAYALDIWSESFFVLTLLIVLFYRNPEREIPSEDPSMLVSPCDGVVKSIECIYDDTQQEWLRVVIHKRWYDVGALRAPCTLQIVDVKRRHGLSFGANDVYSKALGTKMLLNAQHDDTVLKIAVYPHGWINGCALYEGLAQVKMAQRFGFLANGDVVVLLPKQVRLSLSVGDEVKAAQSVLGYFF